MPILSSSVLSGQVQIRFFPDTLAAKTPKALTIYRWNNGWIPLETRVDLEHNTVSADVHSSGYFAAFLDLTQTSIITNIHSEVMPAGSSGFLLRPIYPNPFSSQASIRFVLPVNSKVTLGIFDIYGRKITTLLDKSLSAGEYTETWNCRDKNGIRVPPGVYFCLLTNGNIKLSQKLLVLTE